MVDDRPVGTLSVGSGWLMCTGRAVAFTAPVAESAGAGGDTDAGGETGAAAGDTGAGGDTGAAVPAAAEP